jgi:hypothetical protein
MPAMCPVHHNFLTVNAVTNAGKGKNYKELESVTELNALLAAYLYLYLSSTLCDVGYNRAERTAQITYRHRAI